MKKFENYYLGLDLGTSSLGWSVTNENYDILRFNKKFMWGTHLFDEGKKSDERRNFRNSRRRLKRKKLRIELLQSLFSEEISKVDFGFYQRLKESQYWLEDKTIKNKNTLFIDNNYSDVEYHNEYPTIYHLRKALIDNEKNAFEVRKLYLAIAHIFSHRGHFLFEGKLNNSNNFNEILKDFFDYLNTEFEIQLNFKDNFIENIQSILTNKDMSRTKKKEELINGLLIDKEKEKINKEIITLIVGNEAKIDKIFNDENYKDVKISFATNNFDEKESEYAQILNEKMEFIYKVKAIYDWALLQNILRDNEYISEAKIKLYNEHKEDLKKLKNLLKFDKKIYNEIFKENGLYDNYIKTAKDKTTKEILFKKLKKILENIENDEAKNLLNKIELDIFLQKQKTKDNGVIPRQIHKMELEKILENAENYFEWLKIKDETNLSVSEKIIKIFEFKIPYYIGPLNDKSPFAWIVRNEYKKIFPWNFEKVVNISSTAEEFIKRMTNKCTYLPEKDVIPKNSLLYTKFMVLNELNNLRINGEKISVELKQDIYTDLFEKNKKIGIKTLINYLKSKNIKVDKNDISGIDGTFSTSLNSYNDMVKIFGEDNISKDNYKKIAEDIILWITLYGDEKKLIKNKINEMYSNEINKEQLKQILKLRYKDWGRLSKEFLTEIELINKETGEMLNIIKMMWQTNYNLMELLSEKYEAIKNIEIFNSGNIKDIENFSYEDIVKNLSVSPGVKKMIWRSLVIVNEIRKITKKAPKKIFLEMARDTNTEKKRTEKRKDKLSELYKNIKNDDIVRELEKDLKNRTNDELKSKKLYLYYIQLGKCMYSNEKINLSDLINDNLYDIDHIYPQSKVKDDSFDNIVLVKKKENADKGDIFPLKPEIQEKCKEHWKILKEKNLITNEKYLRLTRKDEFSDDELAGFINRQLVETRQATKIVADILKTIFKDDDTTIVYVKAGLTSDFRQKFRFYKFRELNDYHHAHDSYLNIIVGNIYNMKFTNNPYNFIKERKKDDKDKFNGRYYNLKKIFEIDIKIRDKKIWNQKEMLPKIERYIYKIRPLLTRVSYEQKGGFSDQNISSNKDKLRPLKSNGILSDTKYGGYDKVKNSYFFIVEYNEKKKRKRSIETIPIYMKESIKTKEDLEKYCKENLKLEDPKILISKFNYKSLVSSDGYEYYLNGITGNSIKIGNGRQVILSKENYETYRKIYKNLDYLKLIYDKDEKEREEKFIEKLPYLLKKEKEDKDFSEDKVSEKLTKLYSEIIEKIETGIFSKFKISLSEYIEKCNEAKAFEELNNYGKSKFIQEILKYLSCKTVKFERNYTHNLKDGNNTQKIDKSKILENDFYIINQSSTGLFEKKIYLDKK